MRVFTDERCLGHHPPAGCPEVPERLRSVLLALEEADFEVVRTPPSEAPAEALRWVHDAEYVERFERAVARGDALIDSADNPLVAGTLDAAWGAVEATLAAADRIALGGGAEDRRALAAVRPPGHHAERAMAMGFCYFNNVAVAAEHLVRHHSLDRVAIFDFDVHHGNGTQHLFEERGDVFFASVHQFPFYPGTGAEDETGRGDGVKATLNVPLPAGVGDIEYGAAIDRRVVPALAAFRPQALLISAGFDAWRGDPLGGMRVSGEEIARWGSSLSDLADEVCEGRLLTVLEGGYDLAALPGLVVRYCQAVDRSSRLALRGAPS
ncbi:MAG: histone deacetylase [Acidobacteriota bacterium]